MSGGIKSVQDNRKFETEKKLRYEKSLMEMGAVKKDNANKAKKRENTPRKERVCLNAK
jgi:hypothetical protein